MDETLFLMRKYAGADVAQKFVSRVGASPRVRLIWVTPDHYRGALDLFLNQHYGTWSFTDCTSFTIMREIGIRDAFTFDSAFRQAGFDADPVYAAAHADGSEGGASPAAQNIADRLPPVPHLQRRGNRPAVRNRSSLNKCSGINGICPLVTKTLDLTSSERRSSRLESSLGESERLGRPRS